MHHRRINWVVCLLLFLHIVQSFKNPKKMNQPEHARKPILSAKFRNDQVLDFKTSVGIKRTFSKSCITCIHSKLQNVEKYPQISICKRWSQTVEHFNEGCADHEGTNNQRLTKNHLQYLIDQCR